MSEKRGGALHAGLLWGVRAGRACGDGAKRKAFALHIGKDKGREGYANAQAFAGVAETGGEIPPPTI